MNRITEPGPRLHVELRLLVEPAMWCWDIRDRHSGRIVESSWTTYWMAYDSRDEAVAAGREYLRRHADSVTSVSASAPTQETCESAG